MRSCALSRSSRGLGHRPFKAATRVRIPFGIPLPQPRWLRFSHIDRGCPASHAPRTCCTVSPTLLHRATHLKAWGDGAPSHPSDSASDICRTCHFSATRSPDHTMRRYRKFASGELRGRHETRSRRAKCLVRATFYQHVPSISLLRLPIAKLFELLESSGQNSSKSSWTSER